MNFGQFRKSKNFLVAGFMGIVASVQITPTAQAAEIIIRGEDAAKLMTALMTMGVKTELDDHGGQSLATQEIDCYKPVVPNPKAHCYVQEHSELTEFFDESQFSQVIFDVLERSYAAYDDGSVGASKVGIRHMSCYQGLSSAVTECQGRTWN